MEIVNCIYRFVNKNGEIIYIGKATNLKNRISSHNHLDKSCYDELEKIEYTCFPTEDIMDWAERYYIPKYKPKYNTVMKQRSFEGFYVEELEKRKWDVYKENLTSIGSIDNRVIEIISEKIFNDQSSARIFYGIDFNSINNTLSGRTRRCYGQDGEILCFMYYREYKKLTEEEKSLKKELALNVGVITKERTYRKIKCVELDEVFCESNIDDYCYDYKISKGRLRGNLSGNKDYAIGEVNGELMALTFEYILENSNISC